VDQELFARFRKCAVEVLSVEEDQVVPDAKFGDDLDADSLDLVELVMALEEEFDVSVPRRSSRASRPSARRTTGHRQALMDGRGRRVAITGLGVVAPCGIGRDGVLGGLLGPGLTGGRATGRRLGPVAVLRQPQGGPARRPLEQFALAAAAEAFEQAGAPTSTRRASAPSSPPASAASTPSRSRSQVRLEKGERRVSPFLVPMMMANAPARRSRCATAGRARARPSARPAPRRHPRDRHAARLIAWGRCDAVVAGGAEAPLTPPAIAGFANMTALSSVGHQPPFDAARDGFVMGEGAAVFVLEEWEAAVAAAPRSSARSSAPRATPTPTTSPRRHPAAPARSRACSWPSTTPASRRRHPPGQRPRHLDPAQRRRRGRGHRQGVRRPARAGHVHQGRHRPRPRRGRRARGGGGRAVDPAPPHPAHGEHHRRPGAPDRRGDGSARPWEPGPTISNNFGFGGHNGSVIIGPA
jgi:3-oxoacyl-[acyl-carrier-protein] synthase II